MKQNKNRKKAVKDCTKNPIATSITDYDVTYRPNNVDSPNDGKEKKQTRFIYIMVIGKTSCNNA